LRIGGGSSQSNFASTTGDFSNFGAGHTKKKADFDFHDSEEEDRD